MGILALLCLRVVLCLHQLAHLQVVRLLELLVVRHHGLLNVPTVFVGDLQLEDALLLGLVQRLQLVVFLLVCADSQQKLRVGLLLGHELGDNLTDIRVVGLGTDLLEALLNVPIVLHLPTHALLEERRPKPIEKELGTQFQLIGVLGLVLGELSDLSLAFRATETLVECLLLVLDGGLQGEDALLTLLLLTVDHLHQIIELVLAL